MSNTSMEEYSPRRVSSDAQAMMRFDANKKSVGVAYLLWFFLGMLGGHRFYAGRTGSAVLLLLMTILGWLTLVAVVGGFILLLVVIWVIVDAFLIPGWIRQHNSRLAAAIGRDDRFS